MLSTVYYLGQPLYPIPYSYYKKFVDGEFEDETEVAIPECLGDSYQSPDDSVFRVVATTPELFDKIHYGTNPDGSLKSYEFSRADATSRRENFFEGVIGSVVAAHSGLKVGRYFQPSHGLAGGSDQHHAVKIVGILKPTGTANDRAVFMNIEGFYLIPGHASHRITSTSMTMKRRLPTAHDQSAEQAGAEHKETPEEERMSTRWNTSSIASWSTARPNRSPKISAR